MQRKFVLEFVDLTTGCSSSQAAIELKDIAPLREIIDPDESDLNLAGCYDLDRADIEKIKRHFGIESDDASPLARIRPWHLLDELPYAVHTNRELALMLAGGKPLAAFSEYCPSTALSELIPERFFEPYVVAGLFVKREYFTDRRDGRKARHVLYAARGEEWRIDAYILMWNTAEKSGWNEGFERMEGSLLGYEEWQNDVYIEKIFRSRATS